ncbi:MAG: hypothetical protein OQK98_00850 [Gammaproteobacteria bacterium]|nr:hypothetical protein [Gammaproteobacteria bacterium]
MKCKNEKPLTISLNITDQTKIEELQAYVFSAGGKAIGSDTISSKDKAIIDISDSMDGRSITILLGPVKKNNEPTPTVNALKRIGAYELPERFLLEKPEIDIHIPGIILPLWCRCTVTGEVVKNVSLPDGSVESMPVCNARVHICEVDRWRWILPRIPDFDIFKLREDLLDKLHPVVPPFPIPDPGPLSEFRLSKTLPAKVRSINAVPNSQFSNASSQLALSALINANSANEIRAQLLQLDYLLTPFWCFFPYIWHHYRKDCLRTIDVDNTGHFSTGIYHDCNDQPDLYFWVEQLQDGVWTTVYKPSVACHTHWNYTCGTHVVINAPNAEACEVPEYDIPDGVTLFVLPYKIGHTPIWGTPAGAPPAPNGWVRSDGFVNYSTPGLGMLYDAPFGGTLSFYHDDSYFIPKDDTDPGADDNSIKFYRYSYRRSGDSGDWTAMTTPQSRGYRMEYDDGSLPTYESYPVPPQTIGGSPNLFEFKPRTPPVRAIDPATVIVREWSTGNINDVAASWNTSTSVPAISELNVTDSAGTFDVKVEVFNASGQQVMPGAGSFEFLARNSDVSTTRYAETGEISNGAFVFQVHIDNNPVTAELPQPSIGAIHASDDCGFLRYNDPADSVHIEFIASHPNNHAVLDFTIKRGSNVLPIASTAGVYSETAAILAPPYNKVAGVYQQNFTAYELVGDCVNAAFAADLDVWGKTTNGRYRLGIDAHRLIAFALAETEE